MSHEKLILPMCLGISEVKISHTHTREREDTLRACASSRKRKKLRPWLKLLLALVLAANWITSISLVISTCLHSVSPPLSLKGLLDATAGLLPGQKGLSETRFRGVSDSGGLGRRYLVLVQVRVETKSSCSQNEQR